MKTTYQAGTRSLRLVSLAQTVLLEEMPATQKSRGRTRGKLRRRSVYEDLRRRPAKRKCSILYSWIIQLPLTIAFGFINTISHATLSLPELNMTDPYFFTTDGALFHDTNF